MGSTEVTARTPSEQDRQTRQARAEQEATAADRVGEGTTKERSPNLISDPMERATAAYELSRRLSDLEWFTTGDARRGIEGLGAVVDLAERRDSDDGYVVKAASGISGVLFDALAHIEREIEELSHLSWRLAPPANGRPDRICAHCQPERGPESGDPVDELCGRCTSGLREIRPAEERDRLLKISLNRYNQTREDLKGGISGEEPQRLLGGLLECAEYIRGTEAKSLYGAVIKARSAACAIADHLLDPDDQRATLIDLARTLERLAGVQPDEMVEKALPGRGSARRSAAARKARDETRGLLLQLMGSESGTAGRKSKRGSARADRKTVPGAARAEKARKRAAGASRGGAGGNARAG